MYLFLASSSITRGFVIISECPEPRAKYQPISARPRKSIVSPVTAMPTNFWNDTCTCIWDTWLTCTGQTNYWETIHALNVLTHFSIWILLHPGGRKSLLGHVGLPSDEQTRAIKQRESFSDTSMTMMHCTLEYFSVGTRWAVVNYFLVLRRWNCAPLNVQSSLIVTLRASNSRYCEKLQLNYRENSLILPYDNFCFSKQLFFFKLMSYTRSSTLHFAAALHRAPIFFSIYCKK